MKTARQNTGIFSTTVFSKLVLTSLLLATACAFAQKTDLPKQMQQGWDRVDAILKRIVPPTFPNRDFDITRYGAVGDGKTDNKQAFAKAIADCAKAGGGRVVVPAGTYISNGPIHLDSNVNLHVSEGATILFGTNPEDYLPLVLVRWEGTECHNYSPLIYAREKTNIALTGKGAIDGQAKGAWALWKKKQNPDKDILRKMGNDGVPVAERLFGPGHFLRPSMVQLFDCRNVLIEDITLKDSPFWIVHPTYCTNVTVRRINVDSWNTNNDGCDPDSSTDVLIEDCVFNTGDDSVAIKAGRDQDAWRVGKLSQNIIVRNCQMNSKCNGLCIGSEMSGGVRNIFLENCKLGKLDSALYFKSNLDRGGCIENVFIRNIQAEEVDSLVMFTNDYHGYRGNHFPASFRNFLIENVQCGVAKKYGVHIVGVKDAHIDNVFLNNVNIVKAKTATKIQYVDRVEFRNVSINEKPQPLRPELTPVKE